MYKALYISVTLHIIILLFLGGVIIYNVPTASFKKGGIIAAEIISEPEFKNKKATNKTFKLKVKTPVTTFSSFYDNAVIVDLSDLPVIQLSEQSTRNPDSADSYNEIDIIRGVPVAVQNKIAMKGPASFYGNDLIREIRESIENAKVYPWLARKKGIEGKVVLRFRVMQDGMVKEIELVESSGFEILDKVSVETIKRSAPLPYINGWIEIPLVFRLE
ncbi:MAG: energy transducer TonB [Nitrospirota bacterium]